jgi:hypothetical protein
MTPKQTLSPLSALEPLPAAKLRHGCDPSQFKFKSTAELEPIDNLIGQERAINAIEFGAKINRAGFNIFALGPSRSGRHSVVRTLLESKAASEPVPSDWVYVNNFTSPDRPKAIQLSSGVGVSLKNGMAELIDDLSQAIPAIFESEDYRNRRKAINDSFEEVQEKSFDELRKKAEAQNIVILRTPMGFALAPVSKCLSGEFLNRMNRL